MSEVGKIPRKSRQPVSALGEERVVVSVLCVCVCVTLWLQGPCVRRGGVGSCGYALCGHGRCGLNFSRGGGEWRAWLEVG